MHCGVSGDIAIAYPPADTGGFLWVKEEHAVSTDRDRMKEIMLETQAFRRGDFVLSSGRRSSYYIDGRLATLHPEGAYLTGRLIFERLRGQGIEAVGGLTLGADPIVTAIAIASYEAGEPIAAFIVRKEAKQHGTGRLIEGPLPLGARVAVVEDTVTTGGSILKAVDAAEQAGCTVIKAVTLVDRCEGAAEVFAERGIPFESIFTIRDFGVEPA